MQSNDTNELVEKAVYSMSRSYSPYSRFRVGAACKAGKNIYVGTNVENASYGLSICAERVAIFNAVSNGELRIESVAVAGEGTIVPCGACLQVMAEFGVKTIIMYDIRGKTLVTKELSELLPLQFKLKTSNS